MRDFSKFAARERLLHVQDRHLVQRLARCLQRVCRNTSSMISTTVTSTHVFRWSVGLISPGVARNVAEKLPLTRREEMPSAYPACFGERKECGHYGTEHSLQAGKRTNGLGHHGTREYKEVFFIFLFF